MLSDSDTESSEANSVVSYQFSLQVQYEDLKSISVAILKCGAIVESSKRLNSQLRSIVFDGNGSPFETLHSYISNAVSPYLKSFLKKQKDTQQERFLFYCCFFHFL